MGTSSKMYFNLGFPLQLGEMHVRKGYGRLHIQLQSLAAACRAEVFGLVGVLV